MEEVNSILINQIRQTLRLEKELDQMSNYLNIFRSKLLNCKTMEEIEKADEWFEKQVDKCTMLEIK
nr:MAG TPA: hypothetical protein [Caudoviricetes sp.]